MYKVRGEIGTNRNTDYYKCYCLFSTLIYTCSHMPRLLIGFLIVLSLITAPAMASVCADDCAGTLGQQHKLTGEKTPGKSETATHTAYHCCHASTVAVPSKEAGIAITSTGHRLPMEHANDHAGRNPSPLLEPPSLR